MDNVLITLWIQFYCKYKVTDWVSQEFLNGWSVHEMSFIAIYSLFCIKYSTGNKTENKQRTENKTTESTRTLYTTSVKNKLAHCLWFRSLLTNCKCLLSIKILRLGSLQWRVAWKQLELFRPHILNTARLIQLFNDCMLLFEGSAASDAYKKQTKWFEQMHYN